MKTVKLSEILEYYDGILLFAACDPIGGNYLGEAIDPVGDHDRYAVVGVRPGRMADFRAGRVDLRTVMLEAPGGEWHITVTDGAIEDPLVLERQHKPLEETDYLPGGAGYFLRPEGQPDDGAIRRALERGKVVTLTGLVEQANRSDGEWALLTEDGIQSGRTYPNGPSLDGLEVGKRYRFKCAQITGLDSLWQDKQTLLPASRKALVIRRQCPIPERATVSHAPPRHRRRHPTALMAARLQQRPEDRTADSESFEHGSTAT